MKRLIIIPLILLSLLLNATVYHFAPDGNDATGDGSIETPYQTLAKATSMQASLSPGDSVLFERGGTYTGTLTIGKSGTSGSPVYYGAYGTGDDPVFTGLTDISGAWVNVSGNLYYKEVTTAEDIRYMFIDGAFRDMGKFPKTGTYAITGMDASRLYLQDSVNLVFVDDYWNGAEVVVRSSRFSLERRVISDYDSTNHRIIFASAIVKSSGAGYGYLIQNHTNCLTVNGDWMWNVSEQRIYLYHDSPNLLEVKVSTGLRGIYINPHDYIYVENIQLIGYNGTLGAIRIQNSSYTTVKNCTISYALNGIYTYGSDNITYQDNYINNCNTGININTANDFKSFDIVQANTIDSIGLIFGIASSAGMGIYIQGDSAIITKNDVSNTGHDGIYLRGNNQIAEYNRITSHCQLLDDGGGIYADGKKNIIVRYNYVLGGDEAGALESYHFAATAKIYNAVGIYFDTNTEYCEITHNLSVSNYLNYHSNSCRYNRYEYNYSCKSTVGSYTSTFVAAAEFSWNDTDWNVDNNTVQNNIFVTNYIDWGSPTVNLKLNNTGANNVFDSNYLMEASDNLTGNEDKLVYINPGNGEPYYKTLTEWKAYLGGENEKSNIIEWSSDYTYTTKDNYVVYDYNFSDTVRNFTYEIGWVYYDVTTGERVWMQELQPYQGKVMYRVHSFDIDDFNFNIQEDNKTIFFQGKYLQY